MSSIIMEAEDLIAIKAQQLAAKDEQIDGMVALLCAKDKRIAELTEQVNRMTDTLHETLCIARARRDIERQEQEAGL